ncbi:MAG TPA: SDR family NAD(P)-dependent oxidoreductase, partial [Polyangiaceae bacterium]|nr:SDR family NAD(P)-dependent oxidoreductase [Polyangiaceae bacterium]
AAAGPFFPLAEATDWPPPLDDDGRRRPRRAGVSSFGFGGTNAHVVVEEFVAERRAGDGPSPAPASAARRPALVVLSARREGQLRAAARNLLDYLRGNPEGAADRLDRIAYTLQVGRVAMRERLAIMATGEHELAEKLEAFLAGRGVGGLFRGHGKPEEGAATPPDAAEELAARGEYGALLERWVRGSEVDWGRLVEGERPATIALPAYPFARERYWAADDRPEPPGRAEAGRQDILLLRPEWQERGAPEAAGLRYARHCVALCDPPEATRRAVEAGLPEASVFALRSAGGSVEERFGACAEELLRTVKEVLQAPPAGPTFLQLVVSPGDLGAFYPALTGLLKSANRENPSLLWQLVELDADAQARDPARLLRQNGAAPRDRHVRYEGGRRYVASWAEFESAGGEVPWRRGGVYLITGGAGGLGPIFARDILRRSGGAQVVLVGRRAPGEGDVERLDRLRREAAGLADAGVQYRAADVTDRAAVASLIEHIQSKLGPLNGILHGAGLIRDSFVRNKSPEELREVLAPKVTGLVNLDAATARQPLDLFALFSSVAGSLGNVGQADYAAANAFLGCYARFRNRRVAEGSRRGHTVSIDWPLWQDGGMKVAAGAVTALGHGAMQTEAGLGAFYAAVASGQAEVMVLAGDREAQRRWLDASQAPPALASRRGELAPPPPPPHPELRPRVRQRLRQLLSKVSRFALDRIDAEEPLESYGIDSVLIAQLNAELEGAVPGLSKTLFFEYQTLDGVAGHLVEAHPRASAAWAGLDGGGRRAEPAAAASAPTSRAAAPTATPPAASATATPPAPSAPPAPRPADPGEPIAIIGVSGRYPGAPTLAELWSNLQAGKDCVGEIPPERWPLDGFFVADRRAALAQGKSYSKWGGFLERFADFDPLFFNISPREARDMDPQERLFLETCWATVEDAGYARAELQARHQGRVGVFAGITKTGFDLYGPDLWRRGELQNPQTSFSSVANRVSYALNLQGPSLAIDTMCSASLTAIHEACEHLRRGECDLAIAGGVNLYLHPSSYVRLCAQQMLSADGHCKSFGEGGDGFVPGEGVGAVLLKPLSSALRDGDHVHALILGTSVNHGGKTNGYTVPNPAAQARLVRQAMARAGVSARQVSYVEAHGTGTKLGDPIEVRGLQQAFEEDTPDKQFCAIGSIKSNIGHLEAAAGIAGVTKVLLQMRHRALAPSLHAEAPNANIDFGRTPFFVQRELGEWRGAATAPDGDPPRPSRIAGVSSFGAGGSNGHVVLADYEGAPPDGGAEGPHAIVLSAKDGDRLKAMAGNLARHLRDRRDALGGRLRDVAYTLQIGRDAMDERLA